MAIRKRAPKAKPTIDLGGPGGNAFALLGTARSLARQLGLDAEASSAEMTAGDYEHLIQVFDRHFGDYVDLVRPE
jgi:hypothetical protein